jgi:PST family polysaccharide transporter
MKIKNHAQKISSNQFVSASFYSGISSVIKILTSLVIGKIIALLAGAEGMVLYGQLLSFVVIATVFSGGAISQGIVKYIAEYNAVDKEKIPALLSTAFKVTLYLSLFIGGMMIFFSNYISQKIFYSSKYYLVFIVFGITIAFYSLNSFLLTIINGFKKFKKFNLINIFLNIISLILTIILTFFFNVYGALLSVVLNQSLIFFVTIYILRKEVWLTKQNFSLPIDKVQLKLLLGFALIAIMSSALTPICTIIIRSNIIKQVSLFDAGLYEFAFRITGAAVLFFTMTISTYYLPRISEITQKQELFSEIKKTYIIVLPVVVVLLLTIFFLRKYIILVLASNEFLGAESLFLFFLVGVFFKTATQIIGFVFLSKARIKTVIFVEVVFNLMFTYLSILLIKSNGLIGSVWAFCISNIFYFFLVLILFYFSFVFNNKSVEC